MNSTHSSRSFPRKRRVLWALGFIGVGLASIFFLPSHFPVARSISDSYYVGYSNRVGVLLLLFFLAAWGWGSRYFSWDFEQSTISSDRVEDRQVWRWALIFAGSGTLMYLLVRGLRGFGESVYLIDRLSALNAGRVPFRDFEFAYGAVFLYVPYLLCRLHLTPEAAYSLCWVLCLVAGAFVLAQILNALSLPRRGRSELYTLFCLFALGPVLTTGLNYTLFRFIFAPYFGLLIYKIDAARNERARAAAMAAAVGATLILLLISPEVGVAFAVGGAGYFGAISPAGGDLPLWRRGVPVLFYCGLQGLLLWLAARLGLLYTLKTFATGAFAFPILPAGHILLFFFGCGLAATYIGAKARGGFHRDTQLMVLAVSAGTLFAALGRCDPGHVGFAGLGILLVCSVLVRDLPRGWKIFRTAFLLFFVLLPTLTSVWFYRTKLGKVVIIRGLQSEPLDTVTGIDRLAERVMQRGLGADRAAVKFQLMKKASHIPSKLDLSDVYPGASPTMEVPFGFSPNRIGLYQDPRLDEGFFSGMVNVLTPEAMERKIAELKRQPENDLLLPENLAENCKIDPVEAEKVIGLLFLTLRKESCAPRESTGPTLQFYRDRV